MSEWVTVHLGNHSGKFEMKADQYWIRMQCTRLSEEVGHIQFHCIKQTHARELAMALLAAADQMDQLSNKGKE